MWSGAPVEDPPIDGLPEVDGDLLKACAVELGGRLGELGKRGDCAADVTATEYTCVDQLTEEFSVAMIADCNKILSLVA